VAEGRIDLGPGADRDLTERQLKALPGIGPWTAAYIRMRALGDPDVAPDGDLVLRKAAGKGAAAAWRPWRSYATIHIWTESATSAQRHEENVR
jgi:AraC family transcriptional regulator of adaptative response / DNA-3-methyladenine glycosylase II